MKNSEYKNVTLSLPESLLRRFRIYAALRNQSMTKLAAEAISRMIDQEGDRQKANQRIIARMENPPGEGEGDQRTWTRDELHER